jgi:hypothetical protein
MRVFDPELLNPSVHCFAKCHFCKKLIALRRDANENLVLSGRECPHCGVYIDEDRITFTYVENLLLTSSITSANKIQSFDLAFIPFLIVGVLMLVMGYPLWFRILNLFIYVLPLILILRWFYTYWYRFRFDDPEYVDAAKGMRRSFYLWLVANVLNWSLLLFQPTFILYW